MASRFVPGSQRALAQPYVQAAARRGLTAAQTQELLRDSMGKAYRRTELLSDIRYYKDSARKVDALKSVRRDYRPSAESIPEWRGQQKAPFRWQMEATIEYPDGTSERKVLTIESNRTISEDQLAADAEASFLEDYEVRTRGGGVFDINRIGAWRRASD